MALTTAYLISSKNLGPFLDALRSAKAPEKFTTRFLEDLGFKSTNDRLLIPLLKSMKFLDDNGVPLKRYFEYLDDARSKHILADGIRDAYEDLFRLNKKSQNLSVAEVRGKLKSLFEGKKSEDVIEIMARTFLALVKQADFSDQLKSESAKPGAATSEPSKHEPAKTDTKSEPAASTPTPADQNIPLTGSPSLLVPREGRLIDGICYRIELILPSVRDQAVYDAIFRSLKEHLL